MNELLFGATYYEEYMLYDRLGQKVDLPEYAYLIIVRKGTNDFGKKVKYFLNQSAEAKKVPYTYEDGVELLSGRRIEAQEMLEIPAWGVKIIEGQPLLIYIIAYTESIPCTLILQSISYVERSPASIRPDRR